MTKIRWSKRTRARLHGSLAPNPHDPTPPSLDAAKSQLAACANVRTVQWSGGPEAEQIEAAVEACRAEKLDGTSLQPKAELLRWIGLYAISGEMEHQKQVDRALATLWTAKGGVPFVLDMDRVRLELYAFDDYTERVLAAASARRGEIRPERLDLGLARDAVINFARRVVLAGEVPSGPVPQGDVSWSDAIASARSIDDADGVDLRRIRDEVTLAWLAPSDPARATALASSLIDVAANLPPADVTESVSEHRYPLRCVLARTDAVRLLPNIDDPALATRFAAELQDVAYFALPYALDCVERLGHDAKPVLAALDPWIQSAAERKELAVAQKLVA